jgi:hypothetical protein
VLQPLTATTATMAIINFRIESLLTFVLTLVSTSRHLARKSGFCLLDLIVV